MTKRSRRVGGRATTVVLAPLIGLALAASSLGCAPTSEESMNELRVTDEVFAGPSAGAESAESAGGPNLVGSVEVPVRVYEPVDSEPWVTLVWAHGGSFVRGTLDWPEADWVSRRLAEAGLRVYSVDYVLASDHVKAPAPSNDVAAVLRQVSAKTDGPVIVGGASAGGHLAALAALDEAELGEAPDALALIYPTLHRVQLQDDAIAALTESLPVERRFTPERIAEMYDFYLGEASGVSGGPGASDASGTSGSSGSSSAAEVVGELPPERLTALPQTVIVNADADDLRASAEQFAAQLRDAGVPVEEHVQPGTVHGYMNRPDENDRARMDAQATIATVVGGLRRILAPDTQPNITQRRTAMERAITEPTALTLTEGRLNRDAIGWAASPIIDTGGIDRGVGRNKRWEYWNVATPEHIVALTVSHIDYACVHEVWVYDRASGAEKHRAATVIPARGAVLAPRLEHGRSMARAKNLAIDIDEVDGGTRLRFEVPGASLDVVAALPEGHERLALVVPWSDTRFQYTVKDLARPATGTLRVDGVTHEVGGDAGEAWAVLDHGRGRWPYDINWNWGAGSGRSNGRTIGLQVGAKWTAGTGVSENAFFVDGRMHKIHGETEWRYDLENWRSPWRVTGGGLDATLEPFHNKQTRTNLLVLKGHTDQCFGYWSGTFSTADGEVIEFDGVLGWAEEVHNRW